MAGGREGLIGAIEGGGTKFVCAVGPAPWAPIERIRVPTSDPASTLRSCLEFFQQASQRHGPLRALGIACFGPLQLQPAASDYGCLLRTPKAGWSGANVVAPFSEALGVPVALETDVGAAAIGELRAGAGRGLASLAYVTVGTGIGGSVAPAARFARLLHEEMGHLPVRRDARDTAFSGICPFHGDCLEGLASGPAIRARWGCDLADLPPDHPGRSIIAGYVGQLVVAIVLLHGPQRVVIGGGVMSDGSMLPLVRQAAFAMLGGYLPQLGERDSMHDYIAAPALGADSAMAGAAVLAGALGTSTADSPGAET